MSPTTDKMSKHTIHKLRNGKKLIYYEQPFFPCYIFCLSNDQGLRWYGFNKNCEEHLNNLNGLLSSYYKKKSRYHIFFEVLIGTGVKMEVVEAFQYQPGCYNQSSAALRKFTDNNECLNKKDKKVLDEYEETFKKRTELKKNN